jgi:hypothetical protein
MGEADATQKYDKKVKGFVLHDVPFFLHLFLLSSHMKGLDG